jgi:hypothetical protein
VAGGRVGDELDHFGRECVGWEGWGLYFQINEQACRCVLGVVLLPRRIYRCKRRRGPSSACRVQEFW